ncbi:uncharacterized protein LOC131875321 [Cryptomeria japonica]|uniref:uncharacterized protein LOC131875321 n=1 Tax=Cryptomeria japonica TaxID=3369 RepID=UPI0027DA2F6D|nr:uncharacterized protein LOC131875321 [Cryptomeria japonica]
MVNKDECLMEAVEPWTVWILPMGYEVDAGTLDAYAQHLLNAPIDSKEERFDTCKDKSMELHTNFTEPEIKRKVVKMVEEILVEEGHPREKVRAARVVRDVEEKAKKPKTAPALVKSKVKDKSVETEVGVTSGDIGAHKAPVEDKGITGKDEAEKKEEEKQEKYDMGKEKMIVVAALQAQASQELAQSESEEKKLIEKNIKFLEQAYDPTINLIGNVEGQILTLMGHIGNLEKEKDKMQRRTGELQNLVGPWPKFNSPAAAAYLSGPYNSR